MSVVHDRRQCDRCRRVLAEVVVAACEQCGRVYGRCLDCGGIGGVRRSLRSHATLYHPQQRSLFGGRRP